MLFRSDVLEKIKTGEVTLVFRKWRKPGAKEGGTQLTQNGVIGIDSVEPIKENDLTAQDAADAGSISIEELKKTLAQDQRDGDLYRIRLHYIGGDPRIALRSDDSLSDEELKQVL